MENNQLVRIVVITAAILFMIFVLSIIMSSEQSNIQRNAGISVFIELSLNLIRQITGLLLIVFSIVSLVIDNFAQSKEKTLTKWIILVILGILIIHTTWYLVLAIVIISLALVIIDYLEKREQNTELSKQQDSVSS